MNGLDADHGTALDPRIVTVWTLGMALRGAVIAVALAAGAASVRASGVGSGRVLFALAAVVGAVTVVAAMTWPRAKYRHWRYAVAASSLQLRHGVVVRTQSFIPYFRVQHIDVQQGAIERALGLSHLVVRTAAATTDAAIPGIADHDAEALRQLILDRAGRGDAV